MEGRGTKHMPNPSGGSLLPDRQNSSCPVCLQDTFASLSFSKLGGTQVIWHTPSGKFLFLQPWYIPGAAWFAQSHTAEPRCESRQYNSRTRPPPPIRMHSLSDCFRQLLVPPLCSFTCPCTNFSQDIINTF